MPDENSKTSPIKIVSIALATFVLGIIVGSALSSGSGPAGEMIVKNQPAEEKPAAISLQGEPYVGNKNAPVVIVEFSDLQCPFCKRAHDTAFQEIKKNYIDTGKVLYVVKDFPLSFHDNADDAASAVACAQEQGKYWEMRDAIFENQASWSQSSDARKQFKQYAQSAGLNQAGFDSCIDSAKYSEEVQADIAEGSSMGVDGTPAFFINGIKLSGAQPYQAFEKLIEQELA